MPKPQIFVAYPYSFSKADYRRAFKDVAKAYGVKFVYADEKITNKHILEKIEGMIEDAEFSIFDVTSWNANVALELGIARGNGQDYYILFNPDSDKADVPADLGGIDRLQYTDYSELEQEVARLMRQQFGAPTKERDEKAKDRGAQVTEHLEEIKDEIPQVVAREPGLAIGSIASSMGLPVEQAKPLVRDLVAEGRLETEGVKRGTKYYPPE
jgi:predicted nucleotide-binding protein